MHLYVHTQAEVCKKKGYKFAHMHVYVLACGGKFQNYPEEYRIKRNFNNISMQSNDNNNLNKTFGRNCQLDCWIEDKGQASNSWGRQETRERRGEGNND